MKTCFPEAEAKFFGTAILERAGLICFFGSLAHIWRLVHVQTDTYACLMFTVVFTV